jgi:hypothetical protein
MLPVDSSVSATYGGWAWRAADGSYNEVVAANPLGADSVRDVTGTAGETPCTNARIHKSIVKTSGGTTRTGRVLELRPASDPSTVSPVFLWQYVAYQFKASNVYPGRIGLYRIEADGSAAPKETEVMAPFDTSARFRFFVPGKDTSLIAPPASLTDVRGLDLVLSGAAAERATSHSSAPAVNRLTTAVFFKNVRSF